jgi:UDP-N-acetylmuramyl pentapeptide phosphotransferase/UDP-N-acetylglucosamine-1-phosphate transferase
VDAIHFVPSLLAFIVTAAVLHLVLGRARLPLDRPNDRSLHSSPVPRSGGFVLVPAIVLAWILLPVPPPTSLLVAVSGLCLVSMLDDVRGLPIALRLACHVGAAALVAVNLLAADSAWIEVAIAVLALGWMTNLYNFMDGSDGLAGGMTVIGFCIYGFGAWLGGDSALASTCFVVAAGASGFLLHNFHPARVFLGDAGSIPLGLVAGSLGLLGWVRGIWPLWFPVLVFSPFICDASVTLLRRLLRGERVWRAHREHYYQRLVRSGWGQRRTALAEYFLMLACGVAAIASIDAAASTQATLLVASTSAYAILMSFIDRAWARHNRLLGTVAEREG